MLLQQLISGFLASSIYALFAVGFTMIFGIMGVLNMAHGDFAMVAVYAVIFAAGIGMGPVGAIATTIVVTLVLGLLAERFVMRPGRRFKGDAATEMPLVATLGLGMVLQGTAALLFGNKAVAFPVQLWSVVDIGGFRLTEGLVLSVIVATILLLALEIVVTRTDLGRLIRATARNRDAARIMGINTDLVVAITVAITAGLAAIAGVLVGITYGLVTPQMGIAYSIKGLVAMILGGVGSIRGAVLGAVMIGLVEAASVTLLGSQSRDSAVFLVLLLTLLLRPAGLIRTPGTR